MKYLDIYRNGVALDTSDERAKEFRSYQSYLKEVQNSLNTFTAFHDSQGRKNKLIVLVDELDRCLPDMQLKILERLHHLFDVKNCVVVCAIHAGRVAENMKATYGVDGKEYLRKFFDLTYKLEKSTKIFAQNLFQDLIALTQKMIKHADNAAEPIDLSFFLMSYGDDPILFHLDNRELTRYLSAIVSACNGFGWDKLSPKYMFTIIMGLFINRYCYTKFLAEDDVLKKNSKKIYFNGVRSELHDYLGEFFGVDEEKLFTDQQRSYASLLPLYAETLNKMPLYAVIRSRNANTDETDEYVRLRKLILLYGGDKNIDKSLS